MCLRPQTLNSLLQTPLWMRKCYCLSQCWWGEMRILLRVWGTAFPREQPGCCPGRREVPSRTEGENLPETHQTRGEVQPPAVAAKGARGEAGVGKPSPQHSLCCGSRVAAPRRLVDDGTRAHQVPPAWSAKTTMFQCRLVSALPFTCSLSVLRRIPRLSYSFPIFTEAASCFPS